MTTEDTLELARTLLLAALNSGGRSTRLVDRYLVQLASEVLRQAGEISRLTRERDEALRACAYPRVSAPTRPAPPKLEETP